MQVAPGKEVARPADGMSTFGCKPVVLVRAGFADIGSFACWHMRFGQRIVPVPEPLELFAYSGLRLVAVVEHRGLATCSWMRV